MTRKLRSRTGRGLSTAFAGELIVLLACFLYFITLSTRLLVLGIILAGFVGFASVVSMWRGQDEFGPAHRRFARRGTYLYFLASLFFVLAFLSFGTFTSPTTGPGFPGDNETTSPTTPHRFKDLLPPLVLLATALVCETLSGAHYLWELVGARLRRLVVTYAVAGGLAGAAVFLRGSSRVTAFRDEYGENLRSADLAEHYFSVFLEVVLPVFAIGLGATRLLALYLVREARTKVAEAEADQPDLVSDPETGAIGPAP